MRTRIIMLFAVLFLNMPEAMPQPAGMISENSRDISLQIIDPAVLSDQDSPEKITYIDWVNLQWPISANIAVGGSVTVYVRCYEEGVTLNAGADSRVSVWIGYSSSNTNPNTWTNWTTATFNAQHEWTDEYMASIGNTLPAGIYYYASRIQFDGGAYQFGGYNSGGGGYWDGVNNVSCILTVGKQLATITLGNTLQLYDGSPKQVTATTDPVGLAVQILYNGASAKPVNEGSYTITATINDAGYQGSQTGTLSIYTEPQDVVSADLRNRFIWVMYDQVYDQATLDEALSCEPDVVNRGWFKWGNMSDFSWIPWSWMSQQTTQENAILGGGGTVLALYPGEVDDDMFQRIVDRTALNEPMHFGGDPGFDFYNGNLQSREYLNFLLDWIYDQIDAGANTLHLDGIADAPSIGFSDSCMYGFNQYLKSKYVTHYGWTVSDSRWQNIFDISLGNDCTDGTINTFDYRKFLVRNGFVNNPFEFQFPLGKEFGYPWNYIGSYADEWNGESCRYLYESVKDYAESKGLDVSLSTNGFSKYVDYQTTGVWSNWSVTGGRLDITPSYIRKWREIKDYSMINLHKDIPLIVFHDWGFGMPFFDEIPEADQILWLRVYAPEVFAAGAVFGWPFAGGGRGYLPSEAVMNTMKSLIPWYSSNRDLYIGSTWISDDQVNLKGQTDIVQTLLEQYSIEQLTNKRIIHLINKKVDGNRNLVNRENFNIRIFSGQNPTSVWAVSPDFSDYQKLTFTWSGDTAEITVKSLEAYTVVVLDYLYKVPQRIHFDAIPEQIPGNPDYELQAYASSGLPVSYTSSDQDIATIVDGKIHIVATGSCTITASQAGDANYEAAEDVTQSLAVHENLATKEFLNNSIQIFPNPCHDIVFIRNTEPGLIPIQIYNMLGKSIYSGNLENNVLEVGSLQQGIYILKVNGEIYRLIKE
jgi:hypothetical protein